MAYDASWTNASPRSASPATGPRSAGLLGGPVVNFNVMYRREAVEAEVAVVRGDVVLAVPPRATLLVVALDAPALLGGSHRLGPYDAALVTGPGNRALRADGHTAVVRLTPHP